MRLSDLEEVIRLSKKNENIVAAVLDDILNEKRRGIFTPKHIARYAERLHALKRPLELWAVLYEIELGEWVIPYPSSCDVITFWTWFGKNLENLENNIQKVKKYFPNKSVMAGVYMWDYGAAKPIEDVAMKNYLKAVEKMLKENAIQGAIVCSNCIADIGLSAVEITRNWIKDNGETLL